VLTAEGSFARRQGRESRSRAAVLKRNRPGGQKLARRSRCQRNCLPRYGCCRRSDQGNGRCLQLGLPFTCTDTALEVEAPSAVSPAYEAVMLWVPAVSDVMVNVAAPFDSADVPSDVEPSSRVTFPGWRRPCAGRDRATLKVTLCPTVICVADAERLVVVAAVAALGCTTNMTAE
jgi:hypothetical protein